MALSSLIKVLLLTTLVFKTFAAFAQQGAVSCGTNDSLTTSYLEKISKKVDLSVARTHAGEMLEYRLGIDVDHKTANLYGQDQAKIRNRVYQVVAEASSVFEREMNIKLTVSYIHIWQVPEPYTPINDEEYFTKVNEYWTSNRREVRDAVVAFSKRFGTFYGGYRMCTSNFPGPEERFTVEILAHELGHTLGSPHTHSCQWPGGPIDRCSAIEGTGVNCPPSQIERVNGSIMSYCISKLTFHPLCRSLIREFAEGKVILEFALLPYNDKPANPGTATLPGANGSLTSITPSFEWPYALRTKRYRCQIATSEDFTKLAVDTTTTQSFYQSIGLGEGNYFMRFQPENDFGNSGWSAPVAFRVAAFSGASAPPPLLGVSQNNAGVVSGYFNAPQGFSSYEIQLERTFSSEVHEITGQISTPGIQSFSAAPGLIRNGDYTIRFRVQKQGIWSQWSARIGLESPATTAHIPADTTHITAANPILSVWQWAPGLFEGGVNGEIEISTEPSFGDIAFKRTFINNNVGEWYSSRERFTPELRENTTYFTRSRLLNGRRQSAWTVSKFTTGLRDTRFRYLGIPSDKFNNVNQVTFSIYNRFVTAGNALYVFNYISGYARTTDLQSWESFFPSNTNGQSPQVVNALGASPDGTVLVADRYRGFTQKTGSSYQSFSPSAPIGWNDTEPLLYTQESGFFLRSYDKGIVQIHDGNFTYHKESINLGIPRCIAKDNQENIWTIGDGGAVWRFAKGNWTSHTQFPNSMYEISGMTFDHSNNCYVYGNFGVSRLNAAGGSWEAIAPLQGFDVKKVVFDPAGNMWLASYKFNYQNSNLDNYALVKFANGKTTVYSDGLNFLREPFDLAYFNDQLLIMTTGGEIHAFDENRILSFEPEQNYCPGGALNLALATNSGFLRENRTSVELHQAGTGKVASWELTIPESKKFTVQLPDTLLPGRYSVAIRTTAPEITSNRSAEFVVLGPAECAKSDELVLLQNKPNPIKPSGSISFYLPQAETVSLELFNLLGQKIGDLKHGEMQRGWHTVDVDGTKLSHGVYVYRLTAGNVSKSLRLIRN